MPHIIEITDLSAPELAPYTRLTEAQLRNKLEPEKGIFIAESPKVIGTALDAGCEPLSFLMERRQIDGPAAGVLARCPDAAVYTADRSVLQALTGYALTRGVLCAMRRPQPRSVEALCRDARRVAVLEGIVDSTNIGAIFRSAAALNMDAVLVTPSCCDPLCRRAVRVSMGTVFQVPWTQIGSTAADWPEQGMQQLHALGFKTAAMALTACGSTAAVSSEAAASAAAAPEVTASPEEAAAAPAAAETAVTYPLTVTDQLGREVTIETEPKTLASGYYISTSLLIALGVQDELVGVEAKADKRTIYSLSAPELQSLPSIGTAKEFDLEGCAALTPDLVIVPAKLKDSIPQMEELGLTVLAVKPENQDKLYGAIDLLAQATNTVARGEELKSVIEDNLLSLREAIGDAEAPTVYMAGNSSVLQTAGPAMYQNYMIENAGGLNAAASVEDTYWAEVSYEQVLDWDPDYIILASDADYDVDSVLNDAALADCTAVKEGHVYQLPHAIEAVDSPVPGSFLGSVYLGSVLHPEQVSEQFYHDCADAFYTTYYGFTPASYE